MNMRELAPEERKVINELTLKLSSNIPVKEIDEWVKSLPDNLQIIVVESLDVMNKNFDKLLKHPKKDLLIQQLLKQSKKEI